MSNSDKTYWKWIGLLREEEARPPFATIVTRVEHFTPTEARRRFGTVLSRVLVSCIAVVLGYFVLQFVSASSDPKSVLTKRPVFPFKGTSSSNASSPGLPGSELATSSAIDIQPIHSSRNGHNSRTVHGYPEAIASLESEAHLSSSRVAAPLDHSSQSPVTTEDSIRVTEDQTVLIWPQPITLPISGPEQFSGRIALPLIGALIEVSEQSRFHAGLSWQQEFKSISTDASNRFARVQGLNALVGYSVSPSDRIDLHLGIGRAQHIFVTDKVTYVDTTFTHDGQATSNILGILTRQTVQQPTTTMTASLQYLRTVPSIPLVGDLQLHAGFGVVSIFNSLGAAWTAGLGRSLKFGGPVTVELSMDFQQSIWSGSSPTADVRWESTVLYSW